MTNETKRWLKKHGERICQEKFGMSLRQRKNCNFPEAWKYLPENRIVVYIITNCVTKAQYVGYTINGIINRLRAHLSCARTRRSETPLYLDIRQYGADNFIVSVIPCKFEQARAIEHFLILCFEPEYNTQL